MHIVYCDIGTARAAIRPVYIRDAKKESYCIVQMDVNMCVDGLKGVRVCVYVNVYVRG